MTMARCLIIANYHCQRIYCHTPIILPT